MDNKTIEELLEQILEFSKNNQTEPFIYNPYIDYPNHIEPVMITDRSVPTTNPYIVTNSVIEK